MAKKHEEPTAMTTSDKGGPMIVHNYGEDAGRGFDQLTSADITIPMIELLQGLSKALKRDDLEGAKMGMFHNTVTDQLWQRDKGFKFVIATTQRKFAKFVSRDEGGGFRGHEEPESKVVLDAIAKSPNKFKPTIREEIDGPNNSKRVVTVGLTDTRYLYGIVVTEDDQVDSMAVIPFSSTKIRPFREMMTRISQYRAPGGPENQPPIYGHLLRITAFEDNKNGNEFYVPRIRSADPRGVAASLLTAESPLFLAAREMKKLVETGAAKVNYEAQGEADEAQGEAAPF